MGFTQILAAIDHSPISQAVFEQALDLAKQNKARLLLFHCITADIVPLSPPLPGELGISPEVIHHSYQAESLRLEHQTQQIRERLNHYCQIARQDSVDVECDYRISEAGEGLCQAAQRCRADLIVMGRRGRTGLTEALFGSVSNYVLHHAPCAVLVIQTQAGQAKAGREMNHVAEVR